MNDDLKQSEIVPGIDYGDMHILSSKSINGDRRVDVKCNICGMERNVPVSRLMKKQNRYHHACEWLKRGETKQAMFAVGTVHGDMTVDGYEDIGGLPHIRFKCNVCGNTHKVLQYRCKPTMNFSHRSTLCFRKTHDLEIGHTIGDYELIENIPGKTGVPPKVKVKCKVCGEERIISKQQFTEHPESMIHKNCSTGSINYFEVGKIYGDMLIQDVFYNGCDRSYKLKCQVCGHERVTRGRTLGIGVGFTHERSCPAVAKYDLQVGKTIGDHEILEIVDRYPKDPSRGTAIRTKCKICGREKFLPVHDFHKGNTRMHSSCGIGERGEDTKFVTVWEQMRNRTGNPNDPNYYRYGGRGIKCEWDSILDFKDDMYESYLRAREKYPNQRITLERIDIDRNYCKENCTWCPHNAQQDNTSKTVYFRAKCPDNTVIVDRNFDRFMHMYGLTSRHNLEKKGFIVERISKEEYEKYRTRVPDYLIDHCFKIINDLYLQKVTTDNPIVNIPVLTVSSTSNCHVNPEMEHMLCLEDNPYNLDIKLNTDNKQHVFIVSTSASE